MNEFNVKNYGAKGDGATDDTNAIRTAITACSTGTPNGGIVFFPNGTYLISEYNASLHCIDLPSNVTLLGQSRNGVTLQLVLNQNGAVRPIYTAGTDCSVKNLTINGNGANQTLHADVTPYRAGIYVDAGATRVTIRDVTATANTGDGITTHGSCVDVLIETCLCYSNTRSGVAINGGQRVSVIASNLHDNTLRAIDSLPDAAISDVLVRACYLTGGTTSLDYSLSVDSTGAGARSSGFVITDNAIDGAVFLAWCDKVRFANNRVTVSDVKAAVLVYRSANDVIIEANQLNCTTTTTSPTAVIVTNINSSSEAQTGLIIARNSIATSATLAMSGVSIGGSRSVRIEGNSIVGNSAVGTFFGVSIQASVTSSNVDACSVRSNYISGFPTGVGASGTATTTISDLDVSHNQFETIASSAISFDSDNNHCVLQATAVGNSAISVSVLFGTYPTGPLLIAGARADRGYYSCVGTPNGQIVERVGAMAMQRDGAGGAVGWIKTTVDHSSSGWQQIGVATLPSVVITREEALAMTMGYDMP